MGIKSLIQFFQSSRPIGRHSPSSTHAVDRAQAPRTSTVPAKPEAGPADVIVDLSVREFSEQQRLAYQVRDENFSQSKPLVLGEGRPVDVPPSLWRAVGGEERDLEQALQEVSADPMGLLDSHEFDRDRVEAVLRDRN